MWADESPDCAAMSVARYMDASRESAARICAVVEPASDRAPCSLRSRKEETGIVYRPTRRSRRIAHRRRNIATNAGWALVCLEIRWSHGITFWAWKVRLANGKVIGSVAGPTKTKHGFDSPSASCRIGGALGCRHESHLKLLPLPTIVPAWTLASFRSIPRAVRSMLLSSKRVS